ncbi:protein C1orf43 homolog [Physella acuta]|uniref:protein C1orf43 homolog n=1 Tax=Physella acuta TaxID=109671 RepID=UPI0027DEA6C1|nr:protein C1orf43 homolog [Physella acuta]XP_059179052.1 protein C1orf43 homolog [Physella acuta]XP_059179053.1 protein C1orf43 homolog [Physella acuta]XP_059179054.1 protein C1orf43 homolog [Physella acuta]
MMEEFSHVSVVLFIASGALVFMLLFLFAKRQIMRFALKSARKPHVTIGSDAPKVLREKINQQLKMTENICYEPTLLSEQVQNAATSTENTYYYRMKALDAFSNAVTTLHWSESSVPRREAKQTIQLFLYCLCPSAAGNKEATIIEKFASWYLHARHSPANFGEKEFIKYMELLDRVIRLIKLDQKRRSKQGEIKAVDLEVQIRKGSKGNETITSAIKYESIRMEEIGPHGGSAERQVTHRDMSSGYSSTDRSSSQGSADRLLMHTDKKV